MKNSQGNKCKYFKGKAHSFLKFLLSQKLSLYATHTAYFMMLAIFPLLVLFLSILRYTGLEITTLIAALRGVVPDVLMPAIKQLVMSTYVNSSATIVSVSALTTLWSASRGVYGLITGLNSIYGVSENRGYLYTRSISVFYTFLFLLVLVLTLVLHMFGASILALLPKSNLFLVQVLSDIIQSRFVTLFVLQTLLFTAIFMVFPNQRNGFRASLPGAVTASLGWLLFTRLYSVYVSHVTSYTTIFGSVYVVALGMVWLYCCLFIVFSGGVINRFLAQKSDSACTA